MAFDTFDGSRTTRGWWMLTAVLTAHAFAGLMFLAGVDKLHDPAATRDALARIRLPVSGSVVRGLGVGEAALALAVLFLGGRVLFALLASVYLGFLAVLLSERRVGTGCGCFGTASGTVGPLHVIVDLLAAVTAGVASWEAAPALPGLLPTAPLAAVATIALLGVAVMLLRLTLTALPELVDAASLVSGGSST